MPKKISNQDLAYEFRYALLSDLKKAEQLLRKNPFVLDHPVYGKSESALHYYATENRINIVQWLLQKGANINGIKEGDSPLHAAASLGNIDVVRVLVESGANLNIKDDLEETALHKASSRGSLDVIEVLLKGGADPNIREMCDELAIDQALPRKKLEVEALFNQYNA